MNNSIIAYSKGSARLNKPKPVELHCLKCGASKLRIKNTMVTSSGETSKERCPLTGKVFTTAENVESMMVTLRCPRGHETVLDMTAYGDVVELLFDF